ncbi:hypothetical protein KM043_010511 [Ampulex compressa]|nr:hypothetical protein KM043_010511 [Ampulex compressa]
MLSILPLQRGNSELCQDAMPHDEPPRSMRLHPSRAYPSSIFFRYIELQPLPRLYAQDGARVRLSENLEGDAVGSGSDETGCPSKGGASAREERARIPLRSLPLAWEKGARTAGTGSLSIHRHSAVSAADRGHSSRVRHPRASTYEGPRRRQEDGRGERVERKDAQSRASLDTRPSALPRATLPSRREARGPPDTEGRASLAKVGALQQVQGGRGRGRGELARQIRRRAANDRALFLPLMGGKKKSEAGSGEVARHNSHERPGRNGRVSERLWREGKARRSRRDGREREEGGERREGSEELAPSEPAEGAIGESGPRCLGRPREAARRGPEVRPRPGAVPSRDPPPLPARPAKVAAPSPSFPFAGRQPEDRRIDFRLSGVCGPTCRPAQVREGLARRGRPSGPAEDGGRRRPQPGASRATGRGRGWRRLEEDGKVGGSGAGSPQTSDVSLIQRHRTDRCYLACIVSDKASTV